jgi:CO dehydrogenase/acetyl-CoA synthase alpha subunit
VKFNAFKYKGPDAPPPFDTRANKAQYCFCCSGELMVGDLAYLAKLVKGCVVCSTCRHSCQQNDIYNVILNDCIRYVSEEQLKEYIETWLTFESLRTSLM